MSTAYNKQVDLIHSFMNNKVKKKFREQILLQFHSFDQQTFFLGQCIQLCLKLFMRMNAAGSSQDHSTTDFVSLNATQQHAQVITSFTPFQFLVKHFHANNSRLAFTSKTNKLYLLAFAYRATFDTPSDDGTTPSNGVCVLHRLEERLIQRSLQTRMKFECDYFF